MRHALVRILLVNGFISFLGFAKAFGIATLDQLACGRGC